MDFRGVFEGRFFGPRIKNGRNTLLLLFYFGFLLFGSVNVMEC